MLELAGPSAILELGYLIPSFVSASYIGRHYGSIYLSGFQLANLTTNLFTLSLMYGMYSACETLAPQCKCIRTHILYVFVYSEIVFFFFLETTQSAQLTFLLLYFIIAYGAKNYSEVGVLAIRGFLSSMVIILPVRDIFEELSLLVEHEKLTFSLHVFFHFYRWLCSFSFTSKIF
jgi:hypothetical protein